VNTRINPTLNGPPHLGHAYLALVNQHAARSTGGRFILRGEDDQTSWLRLHTQEQMRAWGRDWLRDLAWLGIVPDEYIVESLQARVVDAAIRRAWPNERDTGLFHFAPQVVGDTAEHYPYTVYLTARVAYLDHMAGVDCVIVGHDLLSRYSLYCYVCETLGLPIPRQVFLPRLVYDDGGQVGAVSKHGGAMRIVALREAGMQPGRVLELLRRACLKDWQGEWSLDNIQPRPALLKEWFE
jgi:glutamyl/glutaminyl-tRNA synthetase